MQKTKKFKIFLIIAIIFSFVFLGGYNPMANAASLQDAKDTISDSDKSATNVTHVFTFTTGQIIPSGGYVEITFPSGFDLTSAATTCMGTTTPAAITDQVVRCDASTGNVDLGAKTITVATTTNQANVGSYLLSIVTRDSGGVEIEKSDVRIYIIDSVSVSGHVDASLTFQVSGLDVGEIVNGAITTATSTATTTPFGTLNANATSSVAQELSVGTNATDGYTIQVFQDHELQTAGAAVINSFNNSPVGFGSTTAIDWVDPLGDLNNANSWGHMGVTSDDVDVAGMDYTGGKYAGISGTSGLTVMSHTGPANGNTQNIGLAKVAYTIKISALQEAGDYSSSITYICTPQF